MEKNTDMEFFENADGTQYPAFMGNMQCELITPEKAIDLLANNPDNRKLSKAHVHKLADDMREGKWEPWNGNTIVFEKDTGKLLDGQHRLEAIVESEKPQWMWICNGVDKTIHMDDNKTRSQADRLVIGGKVEKGDAGSDAFSVAVINVLLGTKNTSKDYDTVGAFARENNERLLDLLRLKAYSRKAGAFRGLATAPIFAAMYIAIENGISVETIESWYGIVATGKYDNSNPWEETALIYRNAVLRFGSLSNGKLRSGSLIAVESFNKAQQSIKAYADKTVISSTQGLRNAPVWIWSTACPDTKLSNIKEGARYAVRLLGGNEIICTVKQIKPTGSSGHPERTPIVFEKPSGTTITFEFPSAFMNGNVRRVADGR